VRVSHVLVIVAACAASAAGAQSIPLAGIAPAPGPNARISERAPGPNSAVAQRIGGPNAAVARAGNPAVTTVHFPNCAVAGAARALPIRRGEPGYGRHLDPAGTGSACD
jgi:hypothetical protein